MSDFIRELASRKDIGTGLAMPYRNGLAYTDPRAGVTETSGDVTWFTISTEDVDRDGDVVKSDGWNVDGFSRNPVVLFDHGETGDSRPVGLCRDPQTGDTLLRFEPGRVLAGVCWDSGPWGQEIKGLVDRGVLSTASIGFIPTNGRKIDKPAGGVGKGKPGYVIESLDLFEVTITPTPANPHAMRLALDRGDLSPVIRKSLTKALGTISDSAGGALVGPPETPHEKTIDPDLAEHKAALDDCVSRKIKYLMDHGEAEDVKQAAAMAYKHCGEKAMSGGEAMSEAEQKRAGKCRGCNGVGKAVSATDMDEVPATEPIGATTEPAPEAPAHDGKPLGAQMLLNCIEHLEALEEYLARDLEALEPDSAAKGFIESELMEVLGEVRQRLHEVGSETYEGVDGFSPESAEEMEDEDGEGEEEVAEATDDGDGQEGEEISGPQPTEEGVDDVEGTTQGQSGPEETEGMSEEEEKERAAPYTQPGRVKRRISELLKKRFARTKRYGMTRAAHGTCMKAADYLDKAADHLDESSDHEAMPEELGFLHKGYASMARRHSAAMRKALEPGQPDEAERNQDEDVQEDAQSEPTLAKSIHNGAYSDARWLDVLGEAQRLRKEVTHLSGR